MYRSSFLLAIFVVIGCINTISASPFGVDCECVCCKEDFVENNCTIFLDGFIHIPADKCDLNQCEKVCADTYIQCGEHTKTKLLVFCTEGTPAPSSTQTTSSGSTDSSATPVTVSTTTENISSTTTTTTTTTTVSDTTSSGSTSTQTVTFTTTAESTTTTTTTPGSTDSTTTTTTGSTETTTTTTTAVPASTTSAHTNTTTPSSANALKSMFQMSHIFIVSILFMFLCW